MRTCGTAHSAMTSGNVFRQKSARARALPGTNSKSSPLLGEELQAPEEITVDRNVKPRTLKNSKGCGTPLYLCSSISLTKNSSSLFATRPLQSARDFLSR
jgi:hypothetical protein